MLHLITISFYIKRAFDNLPNEWNTYICTYYDLLYDNIKEYDRWQQYEYLILKKKIKIPTSLYNSKLQVNQVNNVYSTQLNTIWNKHHRTIGDYCNLDKKIILNSTNQMRKLSNSYSLIIDNI